MFILLVGGAVGLLTELRSAAFEKAESATAGAAYLLEDNLGRALSTTDVIISRMVIVVQEHLAGRIASGELLRELASLEASLTQRGNLLVVDAKGDVVAANRPPRGGGTVNYAHRDYFTAHRNGAERVIGPMVLGTYSQAPVFTVSRRVVAPDGSFGGLVVVGVDARFFTDFYNTLGLGPSAYIGANTAGRIMLRQPHPEQYVGIPTPSNPVAAAAAVKPVGSLLVHSPVDGVDRVVSFRRLAQFNVMVSAGMAVEDILAPWRRTALIIVGAVLLVLLGLGGMALTTFRVIAREEGALASLEEMVRARTAEAELRADEARQANESKTRFLAAASHDLRQPLQAAGMFVEVLAGQVEDDPRKVKVVERLRQSIEATNSLLSTLLDVSALEAGKIKPNMVAFRVMPLLAGLVDQIEPEASAKGLAIGVVPTSLMVSSDPVLLERLLRNLLVNAVRYTETGRVLLGCRRRGDRVVIQVLDSGMGIPTDKVDAVFEDFVRLDNPAERSGSRGLGLGLGVVRRMAALLDHGLELRSVLGKGSCFGVVLPKA
ncbi:Chemotaxis regulator - transmits chemoreceptor signals to flagelllar motor components CheY [Paramagnetospirillum magnetotacticum MS-1]|uniref:histidine kinase n=2 Tax=Paramagnetospirillum magnetotacticum TaxID=188 RepID=A0A0C2YHR7_PARME|nr:Chemotaxis regulator - transmits chemoreceptor signals to flagelllar motor components CheY [Paramagnetospirillum magnetotacticum MS-1]